VLHGDWDDGNTTESTEILHELNVMLIMLQGSCGDGNKFHRTTWGLWNYWQNVASEQQKVNLPATFTDVNCILSSVTNLLQSRHTFGTADLNPHPVNWTLHWCCLVVVLKGQHKCSNTPSIRSLVMDEKRMRPGHWFPSVFWHWWLADSKDIQPVRKPHYTNS